MGTIKSIVLLGGVLGMLGAGLFAAGRVAFGSGVLFTDAYADLGVADATIRGADRERVALANAMVDGEPPAGFRPGPRIHPAGTLARLRYEAIDANGRSVDRWDVRALRPPLPNIEDSAGAETLVEACPGRVRIGHATHLQFAPHATLPIPTGFRTARWVQIDGCGAIEPFARDAETLTAVSTPAPARALSVADKAPEIHAIVMRRKAETGFVSLRVDEAWLSRHAKPIEFVLRGLCRYDPRGDVWTRLPTAGVNTTVRIVPSSDRAAAERTVVDVPAEVALFWVQWIERVEHDLSARNQSFRDALASSGPMLCNDVDLGPAPAGRVPACVPFANRAEARFVPSPQQACPP